MRKRIGRFTIHAFAAGVLAIVAKAPVDGCTMLLGSVSPLGMSPALYDPPPR